MDEYAYKRPKGYSITYLDKARKEKTVNLPQLNPHCMKCGKTTERNYYYGVNLNTGEYGYLCSLCVDKMELSKLNASKVFKLGKQSYRD